MVLRYLALLGLWLLLPAEAYAQALPFPISTDPSCSAANPSACTVWTPAQWISAWQGKVDVTNGSLVTPTITGGSINGANLGTPTALHLNNAVGLPPSGLTSATITINGTTCTLALTCTITTSGGVTSLGGQTGVITLSGLSMVGNVLTNSSSGGTVTSASVATANGFAGTVANATSTPAITISTTASGVLKGNGTAISAATAGTDYLAPTGSGAGLSGIVTSLGGSTGVITLSGLTMVGNVLTSSGGGVTWPTSGDIVVSNGTSSPAGTAPGTGVLTALGNATNGSGGLTTFSGALGTPTSVTLTNGTGLPFSGMTGSATSAQMATNLSAAMDSAFGSTQGDIIYRNATVWTVLTPGTSGFVLSSGGAAANPSWISPSGGSGITALTGDVTASGTGSVPATLATVNSGPGSVGSSTAIPVLTTNGKGLVTVQTTAAVVAPAGTLTGATLAAGVTASSLTSAAGGSFGTAAYVATGTSGGTVPLNNGNNTSSGNNIHSGSETFNGTLAGSATYSSAVEIQFPSATSTAIAAGTYDMILAFPATAGTITGVSYQTGGTTPSFAVAIQIGGTNVTSCSAITVTSATTATTTCTGANTLSAGSHVTAVISSATGTITDPRIQVNYTRTFN